MSDRRIYIGTASGPSGLACATPSDGLRSKHMRSARSDNIFLLRESLRGSCNCSDLGSLVRSACI